MGTLNNQSSGHLLRYSQKFILRQSEERDVEISNIALINFLLCLEYEQNTRLFKVPLSPIQSHDMALYHFAGYR